MIPRYGVRHRPMSPKAPMTRTIMARWPRVNNRKRRYKNCGITSLANSSIERSTLPWSMPPKAKLQMK
jgi:hypothetical protein